MRLWGDGGGTGPRESWDSRHSSRHLVLTPSFGRVWRRRARRVCKLCRDNAWNCGAASREIHRPTIYTLILAGRWTRGVKSSHNWAQLQVRAFRTLRTEHCNLWSRVPAAVTLNVAWCRGLRQSRDVSHLALHCLKCTLCSVFNLNCVTTGDDQTVGEEMAPCLTLICDNHTYRLLDKNRRTCTPDGWNDRKED